jgi:hypothetical protein
MTHYFYTDPLAAAWMAKHFGMVLGHGYKTDIAYSDTPEECEEFILLDYTGIDTPFTRWWVHPDSLHLLEPQIGDLIHVWREIHANGGMEGYDQTWGLVAEQRDQWSWTPEKVKGWLNTYYNDEVMKNVRKATIIQRNDTPFMWPQFDS